MGRMAVVCPECGLPSNQRSLAKTTWTSARRLVPLLVVVVGIGVMFVQSVRTAESTRSYTWPLVSFPGSPIGDGYTWKEIETLHDGGGDGRLVASVLGLGQLSSPPSQSILCVSFLARTGEVTSRVGIGWPSDWIWAREDRQYLDALRREGQVPWGWSRDGARGAMTIRDQGYDWGAAALTILLFGAAMFVVEGCRRATGRRPSMRGRAIAAIVLLTLLGVATWASYDTTEFTRLGPLRTHLHQYSNGQRDLDDRRGVDVGLSFRDLSTMPTGKASDEIIAGAIMAVVPEPNEGDVLVGEFVDQSEIIRDITAGWPLGLLHAHHYDAPMAWSIRLSDGMLGAVAGGTRPWVVRVDLESLAKLLLGLLLTAYAFREAIWIVALLGTRRRIRRGLCVGCGYPLVDGGAA